MLIELLYIEDYPGHETVMGWVKEILKEHDIQAKFKLIHIRTYASAEELKFPGSPTLRIDGKDVEPLDNPDYGIKCRLYAGGKEPSNVPPRQWIEDALRKAAP